MKPYAFMCSCQKLFRGRDAYYGAHRHSEETGHPPNNKSRVLPNGSPGKKRGKLT